jgi:hypothetical protein
MSSGSRKKSTHLTAKSVNGELHLDGVKSLQIAWIMGGLALFTGLILDPSGADRILGELIKLEGTLGRWLAWLPLVIFLGWLVLLIWGSRVILQALRRRAGYPESVPVRPQPWTLPQTTRWIAVGVTLLGLLISMILNARSTLAIDRALQVSWVATAWGLAILMIGAGRSSRRKRLIGVGFLGILLSVPFLFLPLSFGVSASLYFGLWALVLAVTGTWALRNIISGGVSA